MKHLTINVQYLHNNYIVVSRPFDIIEIDLEEDIEKIKEQLLK